jgi:hypothetical protein
MLSLHKENKMLFAIKTSVLALFVVLSYAAIMHMNIYYETRMHTLHMEVVKEQTCVYGNDK